jgi:putative glutamine amidotransferase
MQKPWIGIPTRYHEKTEVLGQIRHYIDAIFWAGGLPLMIPTVEDPDIVRAYVERVDGVLLPGSPTDIDPTRYGAEPHPKLGRLYPERDLTDFAVLELAERRDLPVLGICFGVQSLNVFRGGSLVQDIGSVVSDAVAHDRAGAPPADPATHVIRLEENSLIAKLAGKTSVEVNSYHHQSVQTAGRNLRAVAFAPDGVIEALEDTSGKFVLGLQWHPERGWQNDPFSKAIFQTFIEHARQKTA